MASTNSPSGHTSIWERHLNKECLQSNSLFRKKDGKMQKIDKRLFSPNGTTIQIYFEVQKGATLTIDPSGEYEGIDNPWYDYQQDD